MLKKALVTGGNGFVGSALVNNLIENGYEVTLVLRSERSDLKLIRTPDMEKVYCDLRSLSELPGKLAGESFDVFFHFAWEGVSGEGRKDVSVQMANIQSTIDAVMVAKALGCKRFVGAGSIMEDESLKLCDTLGKPMPIQYLYGAAKLSAHMLSKTKADEIGIDHLWPKITNTYGPGEISPRFINTTLRKILSGDRLEFTSGTQHYDFVYIDDVAEAFRLIAEKGQNNTTYVIGSGHAQPLRRFVESLYVTTEAKQPLNFGDIPFKGVNLGLEYYDAMNLFEDTGYQPKVDFTEGIRKTYDWIKGVSHAKI